MIEPVFQSVFFHRPEIVSAGDFRKVDKTARILNPLLTGALETYIDVFLDAVAVAGRANHCTTAAIETFLAPFLPDRGLEFYVQDTWQTRDFDLCRETLPEVVSSSKDFIAVAVSRLADFEVLEKSERIG